MLLQHWIGQVLGAVAARCHLAGEPLLSALCVHADGTVGDGYKIAVGESFGSEPDDPDRHAAEERLACYRYFHAKGLLVEGGKPQMPPQVTRARRRQRDRASTQTPRLTCPNCYLVLPTSGVCGSCD
jgi:hypothetical protein